MSASLIEMYAPTATGTVVAADGLTYKIVDGKVKVPSSNKANLLTRGYLAEPSSEANVKESAIDDALAGYPKYATDINGNVTGLVGPDGSVIGNMTLRMGSGLPFVMPSSGNVNNTAGAITATTAFDYVIGPSYSYFPAGALYVASPAGWYYTNWTAATLATVYANTYTNGKPTIPTSPTPLTTVAGAYTQATGSDVLGPSYIIPADFMLANGWIEWNRIVNNNNSAGAKYYNTFFGASTFQGLTQSTNPKEAGAGMLRNRGRKTAQVAANASHGDSNNASSITKLTIDTAQAQVFAFACYVAVATDYAIIESHSVTVNRVE